ncbi:hypothetical protein IQ06DRAFT_229459 [Phaeosphaeriaceae sp. SRC1lsM3a]|nr:hypothetical protein IQ06DRAFT_229459 [Stagonospora sp. SRC1lsM3a]
MLVQTNPTELEILFRHARIHPTERACWMPLFDGVVIAAGFPVAKRGDELGLEISVDLLAALTGAQHVVDYRDSAMMKGYSHLFVPVKKRPESVQWHMIVSPDAGRWVKYEDSATLIASGGSIAKVSIAEATSSRAFVGWCSNVESRLGSEAATYDNVDYSQAEEATDAGLRCLGGSLGFQQMGIAQVDVRFGAKDGKCHFQRKGTFRSVAQAAESTLVTLYDTGEKRAWLVPASQVILHVIQYRQKLALYSTEKLDTHIESNVSGMDVLIKNRSIRLSHDEEHSFQDETLIIWSILDWLLEQNVARYQRTEGISIETSWRDHLFGFEFKAIVQNRTPLRLKRTELMKTNGGWPVLVQEVDSLVLFADGFGDVLVPSAQGHIGLCRRWERVPRDRDFLSTTGNILLQLYDEAGSRLNRLHLTSKSKLRWHQGSSQLFEPYLQWVTRLKCLGV